MKRVNYTRFVLLLLALLGDGAEGSMPLGEKRNKNEEDGGGGDVLVEKQQATDQQQTDNNEKHQPPNEGTVISQGEVEGESEISNTKRGGDVTTETSSSPSSPVGSGAAKEQTAKRLWGAATATAAGDIQYEAATAHMHSGEAAEGGATVSTNTTTHTTPKTGKQHLPFVMSSSNRQASGGKHHDPPQGFGLKGRVYIDPHDKLAHFDDIAALPSIPYWDCGYTGSTTSPLPLKDAYFRHALTGATSWSGTDGKHAVLVVTLSPIVLELNSGETQEFSPGQVILLEDVLLPGHRIRPLDGQHEVSILFLTLPQQHYHTGKDNLSLPASVMNAKKTEKDPCPDLMDPEEGAGSIESILSETVSSSSSSLSSRTRRIRRTVLATMGLSLFTLAADFLGKTAPLWLAVGVGGVSFVVAGTTAFTISGEALWTAIQVWQERRKLASNNNKSGGINTDAIREEEEEENSTSTRS